MHKNNKGQALLLVLLAMAVIITVVLSVASRSITDLVVTTQDEESLRAFSAAEIGVEKALIIGSDIPQTQIGDATYTAEVGGFPSGSLDYVYPFTVSESESATVWFMSHDPTTGQLTCSSPNICYRRTSVRFCWGETTSPAVEFTFYYESGGVTRIERAAYDPSSSRRASNGFRAPSGTCRAGGKTYRHSATIAMSSLGVNISTLRFARVRALYDDLSFAAVGLGGSPLPPQGRRVESTGSVGDATRKVEVYALFPDTPSIFDTALFSSGGLSK